MSRDYQLRGPHLVSYKVAYTILFNLISHLYHDEITLHKYFEIKDALFYETFKSPDIFIVSLNSAAL